MHIYIYIYIHIYIYIYIYIYILDCTSFPTSLAPMRMHSMSFSFFSYVSVFFTFSVFLSFPLFSFCLPLLFTRTRAR